MNGKKDMLSGIQLPYQRMVKRTMGDLSSREQLGAGIMFKDGVIEDTFDRTYELYAMVYVIRGRGKYYDNSGNSYDLGPGTIFQRFPFEKHSTLLQPESNWAEYFIDIGPELSRGLISTRFIRNDLPVINMKPDHLLEKKFHDYMMALQNCPEENLNTMIPELLTLINHVFFLSAKNHDQKDDREMVNLARNYFLVNCEKRIKIEDFCRENGWGYERFRKIFKLATALSPGQFIIQKRIDRACEWLIASELSIKEIGSRLGYPSPYEFSHQFKKITGHSPREYRKRQG